MGRFSGWDEAAVMKITGGIKAPSVRKKQLKPTKDFAGQIAAALNMLGISCEREYRFIKDRRFRFDVAIPGHKIAVEFEGGVFTNGRHTRGAGYVNDAKKYNLATMHGWKLLRYTTETTKEMNWEFKVADEIKRLINHS